MRGIIEDMPDFEGEVLTCHSVCRALAERFPVEYVDGRFGEMHDHSWLTEASAPGVIMDMYPVAGASSFIVFTQNFLLPWRDLYKPQKVTFDQPSCSRQVRKLLQRIM